VRRDSRAKEQVGLEGAVQRTRELLDDVQRDLFDRALSFREANTHTVDDYEDFKRIMRDQRGFIRAYWCGLAECEGRIKEETRATIRVVPEDAERDGPGRCLACGQESPRRALFAQAY
jgi:prolyl-tRNA synthetase